MNFEHNAIEPNMYQYHAAHPLHAQEAKRGVKGPLLRWADIYPSKSLSPIGKLFLSIPFSTANYKYL